MIGTDPAVRTLSSLIVPPEVGLRRVPPPRTIVSGPEFWERYDRDTLLYDCFARPDLGEVIVYLPKALNFLPILKSSRYYIDGKKRVSPTFRHYRRFDKITFKVEFPATSLLIEGDGWSSNLTLQEAPLEKFSGKNVLYTMLKDPDLNWVSDWVKFHHRAHGANAVLIANNGSTRYTSGELQRAISSVSGIDCAEVLDVPLPYGPIAGVARSFGRTHFLQTAFLNLARDRFLAKSRAVLNGDIDELVIGKTGQSIFDATVNGWGYITFPGVWRYAADTGSEVQHRDHWLGDTSGPSCSPKYCIAPSSLFGRMTWSVHSLEMINRRLFSGGSKFHFLHCRNICTSWKVERSRKWTSTQYEDIEARAYLSKIFD